MIYQSTAADIGWDERRLRFLLARGLGWDCPIYRPALQKARRVSRFCSPDQYKRALQNTALGDPGRRIQANDRRLQGARRSHLLGARSPSRQKERRRPASPTLIETARGRGLLAHRRPDRRLRRHRSGPTGCRPRRLPSQPQGACPAGHAARRRSQARFPNSSRCERRNRARRNRARQPRRGKTAGGGSSTKTFDPPPRAPLRGAHPNESTRIQLSQPARIGLVQSALLLMVAIAPWPSRWDRVRGAVDSARSPEMNRAEREGHAAGYYEGLIGGKSDDSDALRGDPAQRLTGKPTGWVSFREADVVHYLDDDFLQFELKPHLDRNLFGQPFLTNAFGMHDDPIALEKPEGTLRIAVLGSSMDMGWGVRYQETYINKLEEWLDKSRESGISLRHATRFEVLNFAVAAYSPMQRLDVLRRKVMAFQPDLVIYSATTLDLRLMEIHLCDMLRKRVDLKYDFISQAKELARRRRRRRTARPRRRPDQQGSAQEKAPALLLVALRRDARRGRGRMPLCRRAACHGDHPAGGQGRRPRRPGRAGGKAEGAGYPPGAHRL